MRKPFLFALLALASWQAFAAENYSAVFKAQGNYEDVRDALQFAIEGKGLRINSTNHTADMLARTGADLGESKQIFEEGEQFEFCSAELSRRMMEADPHAIVMCPYTISIYAVPGDKTVYVAFRKPVHANNPKLRKIVKEVEALLTEICKEAIE